MARYTYREDGTHFIRKDIQELATKRHLASLENLETLRKEHVFLSLNRHEKALLTRLIHEKKGADYSQNQAQKKAQKINWLLRQAMGARGSIGAARREIVRISQDLTTILAQDDRMQLFDITMQAAVVVRDLDNLVQRLQEYNERKKADGPKPRPNNRG